MTDEAQQKAEPKKPSAVKGIIGLIVIAVLAVGGYKAMAGGMTKQQWKEKVIAGLKDDCPREVIAAGYINCPRDKFIALMGEPDSTQAVGDSMYLYWNCRDGKIQLVVNKMNYEANGILSSEAVNEY